MGKKYKLMRNWGAKAWSGEAVREGLAGATLLGILMFPFSFQAQEKRPTAREVIAAIQN